MSVETLAHIATAYAALRTKLGAHQTRAVPEGLLIEMRGKPALILTYENAREYAHAIEEAQQ